jgi:hypothetical protein
VGFGVINLAKKYWALPSFERVGLPVAFGLLGIAVMTIHTIHFKRLALGLGKAHGVAPLVPLVDRQQWQRARRIGWIVRTAARYTPWLSTCFAQSLTSAWILKRFNVPFAVYFGVAKKNPEEGGFDAHSWVASGPCAVVGGHSFDRFSAVGCWVWEPGMPGDRLCKNLTK